MKFAARASPGKRPGGCGTGYRPVRGYTGPAMPPIYTAADPLEAELLRAYLAAHGIVTDILGGGLWSARGELQVDAYPRLLLRDDADEVAARTLLQRYEQRGRTAGGADWRCDCGERSPTSFEVCWSCGRERLT